MRRIDIVCESGSLLRGFILGIEYANDSALEVDDYCYEDGTARLIDHDGPDEEVTRELTAEGLE